MPKRKYNVEEEASATNTYTPLSQEVESSFRVCTLLPGDYDSPISCILSQDDWESTNLGYEAISYVWGDHSSTKTVQLNGKPFQVGANLESLLRHLRYHGRGFNKQRRIWIDAICINQASLSERGHQVRRMYQIYHAASRVIVWLGESHSDSKLAFDFMTEQLRPGLEQVGYSCTDEHANAVKSGFWDQWDEGKDAQTLEAIEHTLVKKYARSWSAIVKMLSRSWWSRAWTVQELISARKVSVHCGSSSCPWPLLEMTIQLMLRNIEIENLFSKKNRTAFHNAIEDAHAFAYERYHRVLGGHGPESFPQLMQVTRCRQCHDDRDKVFSILSLLDTNLTKYYYEPDYSESVHAAYTRAARAHILSSQSLHLLSSCCRSGSGILSDLPSWVPQWQTPVEMSYLGGYSSKEKEYSYAASGSQLTDVEFLDQNILSASGFMIDAIKDKRLQVTKEDFDYIFTSAKEEPWVNWDVHLIVKKLEKESTVIRTDGETILQALLTTLIADRHPETSKRRQELKLRRIKQHFWPTADDLEGFLGHVQMFTQGRTLLLSENGYIALAPSSAEIGDKICVLYGCHAPVILHPSPTDPGKYELVGDAYVHGLMDGEGLSLNQERPSRSQAFKIK